MTEGTPPPVLRVELPGVVSWSRPRLVLGGVRYPAAYAQDRDAWALLVALAVREARWHPPPAARYRVVVAVSGGGKRDLDRVCTAVLDALQGGGAIRDDCLVDALTATRWAAPSGVAPATAVEVATLLPAPAGRGVRRATVSGVELYIGGDPARCPLDGRRCFTAAQRPRTRLDATRVVGLLDSGAFSDPPPRRLDPERALERQLAWERRATAFWRAGAPWRAEALVSYDRLIDEVWTTGLGGPARHKRRWTAAAAEAAVRETVEAARYLAARRERLAPRRLVLACQGVDAAQYRECIAEVLRVAAPADWIGLGGWCILGRYRRRWAPAFWETLRAGLPPIARAGVRRVHLFGVLWPPALGGLLWLADRHGLAVSTDSSAPLLAATWPDPKKAGVRAATYRGNVAWWRRRLATLRGSPHYRAPPRPTRQLALGL